jgi:plastocyanin
MNTKTFIAAIAGASLIGGAAMAGGTISGTVDLSGKAPKPAMVKRTADPVCAKSAKQLPDESIMVAKDGKGLDNVLVRVVDAPAKPGTGEVIVNQHECNYEPRVQGAVEGQKVEVKNEDGTLHNVHAYEGTKTLFNQAQPPKSAPISKSVPATAEVIKLKCDVHPWMAGYVVMNKNPYFSVSKDGHFEIKDVPAGKYTVEAWQEKLGTQKQEVTVEDGKTADVKFTFAAK